MYIQIFISKRHSQTTASSEQISASISISIYISIYLYIPHMYISYTYIINPI